MSHHHMVSPMIGQSEMKRGSGLSERSGRVWRHAGMRLWLQSGPWLAWRCRRGGSGWRGGGCGSGGTMHLEDMEACSLGGNLFNLHIRRHHLPLLSFFFFGSPSQCMEFHCGDNKMKRKKKS